MFSAQVSAALLAAAMLIAPAADACSCICKDQPNNARGRAKQVATTLKTHDYVFVGQVVAIQPPDYSSATNARIRARGSTGLSRVTIKPSHIVKGEPVDQITVNVLVTDSAECGMELNVGDYFRGVARRVGDELVAQAWNCNCNNWAVFAPDGPLPDPPKAGKQ